MALTSGRFYEAMCAGRQWPAQEWSRYILAHPLANRLAQRLIWEHGFDGSWRQFRPADEGGLIDIDDEDVAPPTDGSVRLSHLSLLSRDRADRWIAHLGDYDVQPLFEQLRRPAPEGEFEATKDRFENFRGYLSDAFTHRGAFDKLGYQRGEAEDGGFFYTYYKDFSSLGVRTHIVFTGNCLPEENVPAALDYLCFSKGSKGWFDDSGLLQLKDVPAILRSEALADYQEVASKTGGFDPDWRKKAGW